MRDQHSGIDPLWPRASAWLAKADVSAAAVCDLAVIGVPAHATSITPTSAHLTPAAIRGALARYSTYCASRGVDVAGLSALDFGDVPDPDGAGGEDAVTDAVCQAVGRCRLLVALGGDNSITYAVARGVAGGRLGEMGLVTIDAHHDLRDGATNGSPVRRLVEAGLPGARVVQIGIADFANSAAYATRARDLGITVVTRAELRGRDPAGVVAQALEIASGGNERPVYVDIDVDVCDRAEVPACPAAAPGGISADELRRLAFLAAVDPRVRGIDIAEIDAERDPADQRTVRLGALLVLEAAAGLAARLGLGVRLEDSESPAYHHGGSRPAKHEPDQGGLGDGR